MYKYFVKLYNYYNNKLKIKDKHIFYQTDMITALNENDLSKLYKSIGEKIIQKRWKTEIIIFGSLADFLKYNLHTL